MVLAIGLALLGLGTAFLFGWFILAPALEWLGDKVVSSTIRKALEIQSLDVKPKVYQKVN